MGLITPSLSIFTWEKTGDDRQAGYRAGLARAKTDPYGTDELIEVQVNTGGLDLTALLSASLKFTLRDKFPNGQNDSTKWYTRLFSAAHEYDSSADTWAAVTNAALEQPDELLMQEGYFGSAYGEFINSQISVDITSTLRSLGQSGSAGLFLLPYILDYGFVTGIEINAIVVEIEMPDGATAAKRSGTSISIWPI